MSQFIAEEPHEITKCQDSPWGPHLVPVAAEVMEVLMRGMGRGWGKGKGSDVISDSPRRLTCPLTTQFPPARNSTGRKQG